MKIYYVEKDLKVILASIPDFKDYDSINQKVSSLQEDSRLKGVLMLGLKFASRLKDNVGLKLAFFMKIITPVLDTTPDYQYLTKPEIKLLLELSQESPLYKLDLN